MSGLQNTIGPPGFINQDLQGRKRIIPFDQCGFTPKPFYRIFVKPPYLLGDGPVMGIDQDLATFETIDGRSGEMDLHDPVDWNTAEIILGIEAVIASADIDVVDIEQDPAIGPPGELGDKFPLRDRSMAIFQITRQVLDEDGRPKYS